MPHTFDHIVYFNWRRSKRLLDCHGYRLFLIKHERYKKSVTKLFFKYLISGGKWIDVLTRTYFSLFTSIFLYILHCPECISLNQSDTKATRQTCLVVVLWELCLLLDSNYWLSFLFMVLSLLILTRLWKTTWNCTVRDLWAAHWQGMWISI